ALTFKGSVVPDNRYYELDVTDLVKEYTSGKYENTGFLIKARTESNDYIAFYSSDCGNQSQVPKLQLDTSFAQNKGTMSNSLKGENLLQTFISSITAHYENFKSKVYSLISAGNH